MGHEEVAVALDAVVLEVDQGAEVGLQEVEAVVVQDVAAVDLVVEVVLDVVVVAQDAVEVDQEEVAVALDHVQGKIQFLKL